MIPLRKESSGSPNTPQEVEQGIILMPISCDMSMNSSMEGVFVSFISFFIIQVPNPSILNLDNFRRDDPPRFRMFSILRINPLLLILPLFLLIDRKSTRLNSSHGY